jgi:branched-chain amino acid transport system permease protein
VNEFMGQFLLTGLLFGAGYSLLALGIVLVYKGSRVFNFAQGEFGTVAAMVMYLLQFHVPVWVAALGGVAAALAMGLAMERLVVQPLFNAAKVTLLVATVAVTLGAISLQLFFLGGGDLLSLPPLVGGQAFAAFGAPFSWQQILAVIALGILAVLLYLFFSRTSLGLAVLAASQEPTATDLVGIGTRRMSMLVWGMAALFGGLAGVILAPAGAGFTPAYVTSNFLIFAFVAAVVGGMTSMPGAVLGGLVLGLVQTFSTTYLTKITFVADNLRAGIAELSVFAVLLIVLLIRPAGLLGKEA